MKNNQTFRDKTWSFVLAWHASDFFLEGDVVCIWAGVRMEPKAVSNRKQFKHLKMKSCWKCAVCHCDTWKLPWGRTYNDELLKATESQPHVMDVMDNPFPRSLGLILFIRTQDYCKALAHCRCSREDYKLHMVQTNLLADLLYGSKPHARGSEPTHGRYRNPTLTRRSEIRPETLCAESPLFNLQKGARETFTQLYPATWGCLFSSFFWYLVFQTQLFWFHLTDLRAFFKIHIRETEHKDTVCIWLVNIEKQ